MPGYIEPSHMWMIILVIIVWFVFKSFSVVIDEFAGWVRSKVQHRLDRQDSSTNSANASEASPDRRWRLTRLVASIIRRLPWTRTRQSNVDHASDIESLERFTTPPLGDDSREYSIPLQNIPRQQEGRRASQPDAGAGAGDSNAVTTGLAGIASVDCEGSQIDDH
ncbi:hypothetical protein P168DRAFT_302758 [Aspergillus campestris IBT 28561]|uniref:Uncharacterized protein n=1 Tax=Aspergillus campestris (strain IBT 28561) TaxID=1392248 RepID=A0A2I1D966_ASPC2|nr:uncharacterized protein P168DRAFT_302758 [Aspergillus campestris IBT 28561]PKY06407.1 hypothetical protein P168DRAFT_302758 [Aspergillus campestris IBT 28561]